MKIFKALLLSFSMLSGLGTYAQTAHPDTLVVVQESQFLHYPFGIIKNFKSYSEGRIVHSSRVSYVRPYKNEKKEQTKMFIAKKSFVKFYADRNTKNIETVNAIIFDMEIPLQNGVVIGIGRADFLKKMNISDNISSNASIVELTSKEGDIHHYYKFQNDRLAAITILSQLFYQKE